mgnify:CR=1 FL=1
MEEKQCMMRRKNDVFRKVFILIGLCLLVASVILLFAWRWSIRMSGQKAIEYVSVIRELIPESQGAVLEERRDNRMATLSVDGIGFVGLLEIPKYDSVLPVCDDWGKFAKYPCRFSGSIYDRTMQIGGTSQKGQYDFYRDISVGDSVFFTDVEGNRFSYSVTNIRYEKNADQSTLLREDASLTLFIKNVYAFEYIIIYCDALG